MPLHETLLQTSHVHEGHFTRGPQLRVAFDPQTFLRQRTGGISRLFTDLIVAFNDNPELGVDTEPMFTWVNNLYAGSELSSIGVRCTPQWLPREMLYPPWILRGLPGSDEADLVHHTYYSKRFLRPLPSTRRVTTVYDMIPERFQGSVQFTGSHLAKREYVMNSDLVIAISQSTLDDLHHFMGKIPGKTAVIPLAVGAGFRPDQEAATGLPREYLLYVGARNGYKDFALLPQAIRLLNSVGLDIDVVVVGGAWSAEESRLLSDCKVANQFHQVALGDSDLRRAYANCVVAVQTSRYEGFGMPPLEAMASGVPTLIARASSMIEVGGDVARYFEPGDVESLAAQLAELLGDDQLRKDLGGRGVVRAGNFSTLRMATATAAAYREVL